MRFNVEKLKGLLEDEAKRREDALVLQQQKDNAQLAEHRDEWVKENWEKISSKIEELAQLSAADLRTDDGMATYKRVSRNFPDYWNRGLRSRSREDLAKASMPAEMRQLKATLNVITDEEVSVHMLEKLGFTRDAMRTVVQLLNKNVEAS